MRGEPMIKAIRILTNINRNNGKDSPISQVTCFLRLPNLLTNVRNVTLEWEKGNAPIDVPKFYWTLIAKTFLSEKPMSDATFNKKFKYKFVNCITDKIFFKNY